ncbi:MAG: gliding motility-associated C-terminal domain-containing protein [Flavobacteriales bacterium]|nr:gliding motility-associated C-terminal domain-containing protein [Flavobacteriales bacterium]
MDANRLLSGVTELMHICRLPPLLLLLTCTGLHAQPMLRFTENRGQWPEPVTFRAEAKDAVLWCERGAILIDRFDAGAIARLHAGQGGTEAAGARTIRHHALRLRFLQATGPQHCEGLGVQRGRYNFFQGNDPARWAANAHAFSAVVQHHLYPGIDLRLRQGGEVLKYDLVAAPGSDPRQVQFTYEGADGLRLEDGRLVVATSLGDLYEEVPLAYQVINGKEQRVDCRYALRNNTVSFVLGTYDRAVELVIDPTIAFSSYSGSSADNFGYSATFDSKGFLYSGSSAFGQGYPTTTGAFDETWNGGTGGGTTGTDIALTKWDTTGTFLIWSTYLGGAGDDLPHSLIVNAEDELIVLGTTGSANFPTTANAFQPAFGGGTAFAPQGIGTNYPAGTDMILARFSADGAQLLAGTYVGGSSNDGINSGAGLRFNYADEMRGEAELTPAGNILVASCTQSSNFPTTPGAYRTTFSGGSHDAVLFEMDPALTTMNWGTFFGGTAADAAYSVEVDGSGTIYIAGGTSSADLPSTPGAVMPAFQGGAADGFAARLNADGSALMASTYFGSTLYDQFYFVGLDLDGNVYLFGQTSAPAGSLISGASYFQNTGGQLLAKLSPALTSTIWSSRTGATSGPGVGMPNISPTAFLVDYCDKIYISGWGSAVMGALTTTGLPVTPDAFQPTTDGNDFYLAVYDMDMTGLSYATYFGGSQSHEHVDGGTSRFDRRGRVYGAVCAGCGSNDDFPSTPNAWSSTNNSFNCNLGVFKFDFDAPLVIAALAANGPLCANAPVQFSNLGNLGTSWLWDFGDGNSSTAQAPSHTYTLPGTYTVQLHAFNPNTCNASDSATIQVQVLPEAPALQPMDDLIICGPADTALLIADALGTADHWIWSSNAQFTDTLNATTADSTATLSPVVPGTYYVQATAGGGCKALGQLDVIAELVQAAISPDLSICADDTATLFLSGIDPGSSILWSPAGLIISGQGTAQIQVAPPSATYYAAFVEGPGGCTWADSALVNVGLMNGSSVTASVDQPVVLAGTVVHLSATPPTGVTYAWQPAGAVSNAAIAAPTATVNETTTFIVTVSDGICSAMDSVTVHVHELVCAEPDIFVPDAFTPNGDGNNDLLFVRGRNVASMELKVFDRWGEVVFATEDQAEGWDGSYKGKPVDPAVYVYWLTVRCTDGQDYFHKGNVTVIR